MPPPDNEEQRLTPPENEEQRQAGQIMAEPNYSSLVSKPTPVKLEDPKNWASLKLIPQGFKYMYD